jgi:MFS family permease
MSLRDRISTSPRYKWYVLGVLTAVYTSSHVDRQIMGILLEPIKIELDASDTQMGFLVGLTFALFYATLGLPIAMLADRKNRRNIIAAATTLWSVMTVACGFTASFVQLALARIGVGVGEAGSLAPSHSIISDLFEPKARGTAMGVLALGVNIGILIAYLVGGWTSENFGWRMTFIAVGLPGVAIAALLYFTIREPKRGASEHTADTIAAERAPSFLTVAGHMWRVRSTRHLLAGFSLAGLVGYGFVLWMPSFFVRSYGLSPTQVGLTLALMFGVVGGLGTFVAGRMTDVLARRDIRWRAWIVAVGMAVHVPFMAAFFLIDELWLALTVFVIPAFFSGFYLAPTFALVQGLVGLRMRALASSITLFAVNIIGLGLGPQLVGIMSDGFATQHGQESLRMALLVLTFFKLWSAFHYYLAARTLPTDLEAIEKGMAYGLP